MLSLLKKIGAAGVAALALGMMLGFALSAESAQARPIYMEYRGVDGDVQPDSQSKKPAEIRAGKQRRVTPGQLRRILRRAKPSAGAPSGLASPKRTPPPPGRPGSLKGGGVSPGITCDALGLCLCDGAASCNILIAACAEVDGHLYCGTHDDIGRPISCSCFK